MNGINLWKYSKRIPAKKSIHPISELNWNRRMIVYAATTVSIAVLLGCSYLILNKAYKSVTKPLFTQLNHKVVATPGEKIDSLEAKVILDKFKTSKYMENKTVNIVFLEDDRLGKYRCKGLCGSANDQFYLGFDKNNIYIKPLLHEIGHVIAKKSNSQKKNFEDLILEFEKDRNIKRSREEEEQRWEKYILSTQEAFCNYFALREYARLVEEKDTIIMKKRADTRSKHKMYTISH